LNIRPYHPEDEKAVIDLWRRCGLVVPWNNPARDIERKLAVNPEWFLLGEMEERIVASCMAGYEGHRGWINYLAVDPAFQRRSIGTRMMAAAERLLEAAGCPKINLLVRSSNAAVINFYDKLGYRQDEAVCLGKRIDPDFD
jgi:ribosomal protein S18 acetylase RimI-like enzyme